MWWEYPPVLKGHLVMLTAKVNGNAVTEGKNCYCYDPMCPVTALFYGNFLKLSGDLNQISKTIIAACYHAINRSTTFFAHLIQMNDKLIKALTCSSVTAAELSLLSSTPFPTFSVGLAIPEGVSLSLESLLFELATTYGKA